MEGEEDYYYNNKKYLYNEKCIEATIDNIIEYIIIDNQDEYDRLVEKYGKLSDEPISIMLKKYRNRYIRDIRKYSKDCILAKYDNEGNEICVYDNDGGRSYAKLGYCIKKKKNKKYGGNNNSNMSAEQQRFRQIYEQRAHNGDYAGGLSLGGARGIPKRCPKGTRKQCTGDGLALGGAVKGSKCKKGAQKMQKSGVKRCSKFTVGHGLNMDHYEMPINYVGGACKVKQTREPSNWVKFLKDYSAHNGISYAEALQHAKKGPNGVSMLRGEYNQYLMSMR